MLFAAAVEKDLRRATENGHDHVLPSVVIQIAEGGSASGSRRRAARISALEATVVIHRQQGQFPIVKRGIDLLNVVEDVTLRDEEILPAIVVKIFQAHSPP